MDERRKAFGPYARALADLMGLRDWTVNIEPDPPEHPSHAACSECIYGRKRVNIALSEGFLRSGESYQRATMCHELIHAHMAPMDNLLHRIVHGDGWEAYKMTLEYAVDGMAEEWAKHLPLPSGVEEAAPERPRKRKPGGRGR